MMIVVCSKYYQSYAAVSLQSKTLKQAKQWKTLKSQRRIVRCGNEAKLPKSDSSKTQILSRNNHQNVEPIHISIFAAVDSKIPRKTPPPLIGKQAEVHNWYAA